MTAEDLLTRTLRERTDRTEYPTTPMSTVTARARAVRSRRRRATVLAAAAAVAAIAVPSAVWLNHAPAVSPTPGHELTSGPTSPPTVHSSIPTTTGLDELPHGPKPALDYVDGDVFVGISGEELRLPRSTISVLRAPQGGLLIARTRRSPETAFAEGLAGRLSLVDSPDHAGEVDLGCGSTKFAFSADGTQAAYWTMTGCDPNRAGTLHLGSLSTMGGSGPTGLPTPPGEVDMPVGFLSGDRVVVNAVKPDGSPDGVFVTGSGGRGRISGLESAEGVSESTGVVSGSTSEGHSVVVDAGSGAVRWRAQDDWVLGKFSLDGAHVIAARSVGPTTHYSILDAVNGRRVADVPDVAGAEILDVAWAEDGSLMLVLDNHHESAIARCTLDGQLSRATAVATDGDVAHYRFGSTA